jgi:hypothetical protein
MAAIGRIRKHGVALMIIIGIALLAFIVGDLTRIMPSITNRNLLGKIDSKTIRMDGQENTYTSYFEQNRALFTYVHNLTSTDDEFDQSLHDFTWEQIKQEVILDKQLAKMGITFHDEMVENISAELVGSLTSQKAMRSSAQQYLIGMCQRLLQNSGLSVDVLMDALNNINDHRGTDLYNMYKAIERMAVLEAKNNAYFALMGGSTYFSAPLLKQVGSEKTVLAQLALVNPNAPAFQDVQVNVDENEAKNFFKSHKDRYIAKEDGRDIDFAIFPIVATPQDRQNIEDTVKAIYSRFEEASSIGDFVKAERKIDQNRKFSTSATYYWSYNDQVAKHLQLDTLMYLKHGESALQQYGVENRDEEYKLPGKLDSAVFHSPAGTMIAPYLDGNFWYFGKVREVAQRPDSIQTTFLTIPFKYGQNTVTMEKEEAKALADSLAHVVTTTTNIFTLLPQYKNDRIFGIDSTFWFEDMPDTLYNKLIQTGVGQVYVHEAIDCYLVMQVLSKTQLNEKRQYVLYPVPIEASKATIESLRMAANDLAAASDNVEKLEELAQSKGAILVPQVDVKNMQGVIYTGAQEGLMCREAISWAFDKDTKVDAVSRTAFDGRFTYSGYNQPKQLGAQVFIVAGVKRVKEAGKAEFENVKDMIIDELSTEKKIAAISEKLNGELASTTIQELANKYGFQLRDSLKISLAQNMPYGIDNAIIGKLSTMEANGKPVVVSSQRGLCIATIYSAEAGQPSESLGLERNILRDVTIGRGNNEQTLAMEDLMKDIKIVDRRHNFYRAN